MGTGFLLDDGTIVTAAHVVDDALSISAQSIEGETTEAFVSYRWPEQDLAVLNLQDPIGSESFALAAESPSPGSPISLLGYPLGTYSLQITQGIVKGLGEVFEADGGGTRRLNVTDAAGNGGNSGGPVVDTDGQVVGVFTEVGLDDDAEGNTVRAEGTGYFVPVEDLRAELDTVGEQASAVDPCATGEEDQEPEMQSGLVLEPETDPLAATVGQLLYTHGLAINQGRYDAAFSQFTSREQRALGGLDEWTSGVEKAFWDGIDVLSAKKTEAGATARVALRTTDFLAFDEYECSVLALDYTLVWGDGGLLIDQVKGTRSDC